MEPFSKVQRYMCPPSTCNDHEATCYKDAAKDLLVRDENFRRRNHMSWLMSGEGVNDYLRSVLSATHPSDACASYTRQLNNLNNSYQLDTFTSEKHLIRRN